MLWRVLLYFLGTNPVNMADHLILAGPRVEAGVIQFSASVAPNLSECA